MAVRGVAAAKVAEPFLNLTVAGYCKRSKFLKICFKLTAEFFIYSKKYR